MEDNKSKEKYYRCRRCGTKNPITATFCSKCNESLSVFAEVIIPDEDIVDGPISHIELEQQIISTPVNQQTKQPRDKKSRKKIIIILLAIVLGIALLVAAALFVIDLMDDDNYYGYRPIVSAKPSEVPDGDEIPTIDVSNDPHSTITPIVPTEKPTGETFAPTLIPDKTQQPTIEPSVYPTMYPTLDPTVEPTAYPTGANSWKYNKIKAVEISSYNEDYLPFLKVFDTPYYCSQIVTATFLDNTMVPTGNLVYPVYDISKNNDCSVVCWFVNNGTYYDMFIAADGGINGEEAENLFYGYINITEINFNNNFHTDYTQSFSSMFDHCYKLKTVDVESFNTNSAKDMSFMFSRCKALKVLDLSNFKTSLVTDMRAMFQLCTSLTSKNQNNDMFDSFDTSNVVDMSYMFCQCKSLNDASYIYFDTSNVTDMECMFYDCLVANEAFEYFVGVIEDLYDVSKVTQYDDFMKETGWEHIFTNNAA